MKKLSIFILALCFASSAYAGTASIGKIEQAFTANTVIAGTGYTTITRTFNVANIKSMGLWWKLNTGGSSGTSNTAVYMEASYNDTPTNFATVTTLTSNSQAATVNTLTFPNMKFVRFRATGLTNQATDSTITAHLFTQE